MSHSPREQGEVASLSGVGLLRKGHHTLLGVFLDAASILDRLLLLSYGHHRPSFYISNASP